MLIDADDDWSRSSESEMGSARGGLGLSLYWDVFLPLGLTGVPAGIWMALSWLTGGLDQPGVKIPNVVLVAMLVLQTAGISALAFVALMRRDMAMSELRRIFPDGPSEWRELSLAIAIVCITLFDILANLAALSGAAFLFLGAFPLYLAYLVFVRLALW